MSSILRYGAKFFELQILICSKHGISLVQPLLKKMSLMRLVKNCALMEIMIHALPMHTIRTLESECPESWDKCHPCVSLLIKMCMHALSLRPEHRVNKVYQLLSVQCCFTAIGIDLWIDQLGN